MSDSFVQQAVVSGCHRPQRPTPNAHRAAFMLLLLVVLSRVTATAQIGDHRSEFAVGLTGGYALSTLGFVPEVPQVQHPGYIGGLVFRYTSEKYFSSICAIVGEVNYAKVGWKEDILTPDDEPVINSVTGVAETYQRDLFYLQVPLMARLGWGRERRGLQVFFQAGPQFGYFMSESTTSSFDFHSMNISGRTSTIVAQDTMAVQNRVDYGICAGLGLEFSHPKVGHFLLEGRYYYGLGNIYPATKRDYFARSNFAQIIVKLSYLFDLSKTNNPKIK